MSQRQETKPRSWKQRLNKAAGKHAAFRVIAVCSSGVKSLSVVSVSDTCIRIPDIKVEQSDPPRTMFTDVSGTPLPLACVQVKQFARPCLLCSQQCAGASGVFQEVQLALSLGEVGGDTTQL